MNILNYKKPGILTSALILLLTFLVACSTFTEPVLSKQENSSTTETQQSETTSPTETTFELSETQIAIFFKNFQTAVFENNKETVADLFNYPKELVLPGQSPRYIYSATEFLPEYDKIFTDKFIKQISEINPEQFSYDSVSGISWNDGLIWANVYNNELKLISAFPSREDCYIAYYEGNTNATSQPEEDPMFQVNGIHEANAQDFIKNLITLLSENRQQEVAAFIHYPVSLFIDGKETVLNSTEDFLTHYDTVMTSEFIQTLSELSSQPMNYRYNGTFLGNGKLWINLIENRLYIISMFPSESVQLKPSGNGTVTPSPASS